MLYVKDLHKSYMTGKKEYPVLKGINFQIAKGEFVAVMGPSGSGKSTLLNCISCYIPFDKGEITLGGIDLTNLNETGLAKVRNEKLGFVFQDFMLLDGLSVRENILVPRIIRGKVDAEAERLADRLISLFGIEHIKNKYPAEISGGEKQRTAVARSLINDPYVILADEPTGNLDTRNSCEIMQLLRDSNREFGQTMIVITHDEEIALAADRIIAVEDGRIVRDERIRR